MTLIFKMGDTAKVAGAGDVAIPDDTINLLEGFSAVLQSFIIAYAKA